MADGEFGERRAGAFGLRESLHYTHTRPCIDVIS